MSVPIVLKAEKRDVQKFDWGELIWFASAKQGNADGLTLGQCTIRPGKSNPRHSHPNCAETLYVLSGRIMHTAAGGDAEMTAGDTITVPRDFVHNARNAGTGDAVLLIAFSAADRQVKGE